MRESVADALAFPGRADPFERYRLILARYSAKFPANLNKDGSLTPADQKELAWIVYSTPTSPTIAGCALGASTPPTRSPAEESDRAPTDPDRDQRAPARS